MASSMHAMLSSNQITPRMVSMEFGAVLARALKLDHAPAVTVESNYSMAEDVLFARVTWSDQQHDFRWGYGDLLLSLDDFSRKHVLPLVGKWTGRMDDEGHAIINPVHDAETLDG